MEQSRIEHALKVQDEIVADSRMLLGELRNKKGFYPPQTASMPKGYIKRPSGLLVPKKGEGPQVIINEFRRALFDSYLSLFDVLKENIQNPLFSFAERTLLELTTKRLFIELSPVFAANEKRRVAALTQLDFEHKRGSIENYNNIIVAQSGSLKPEDVKCKPAKIGRHSGEVIDELVRGHYDSCFSAIDSFSIQVKKGFLNFLHMRLHGSPIAVSEAVSAKRPLSRKMRRQTLLVYSSIQVLDYWAQNITEDERALWHAPMKRFQSNFDEIRVVFDWLSKNGR